jgi:hypothetical protein
MNNPRELVPQRKRIFGLEATTVALSEIMYIRSADARILWLNNHLLGATGGHRLFCQSYLFRAI